MKTFKNKNFIKRDYECTNIVFCQADKAPANGSTETGNGGETMSQWAECNEDEIAAMKCSQLYLQNGVRYFGYL